MVNKDKQTNKNDKSSLITVIQLGTVFAVGYSCTNFMNFMITTYVVSKD